ncbi:hypothetical protein A9495_06670 [Brachyspira hampsonii]|nr:hypothetical protein A9495_06670 [Brachyspira hampsonii]
MIELIFIFIVGALSSGYYIALLPIMIISIIISIITAATLQKKLNSIFLKQDTKSFVEYI